MVKSFPYHRAFGVQGFVVMLTWNTSLCITHTHTFSPATCTSTLEVRELGSLYGGVFSFADCDLWACAVGGDALRLHFLPVRGRGTGQGMDWGKREQWAIEITQSSGSQCNCVGPRLCLPRRRERHLWSNIGCPHVPLKPRLSHSLKGMGGKKQVRRRKWNDKWVRKKEPRKEGNVHQ